MLVEVKKYTTKEVSKQLKIPVGNLRQWETMFPSLIYVQRTKTGARIYTDYELEILKKIKLLKDKNMNDEDIRFILETASVSELDETNEEIMDEEESVRYLSLKQEETVESVRNLTDSLVSWKREFMDEFREVLKHEVKKEIIRGNNKTKSMVESFSQVVLQTSETTNEEIKQLRHEIEREEEEKIFIQQKLEEREVQFQEFVHQYRQVAAAKLEQKEKRKFPNLLSLFNKSKKEEVDFSKS